MKHPAGQQHRVNRAMNFARSNLAEALDLASLADVACLSKHHFARIFEARFHETPSKFVTRVRLELAARRLVYMRNRSITQIALECGFSGSDTFSRSFRTRFGSTPKTFRTYDQLGFDAIEQDNSLSLELLRTGVELSLEDLTGLHVRIEERPDYRVAYIRHVGPYGDVGSSISRAFDTLQRWAKVRGLIKPETSFLGVCSDSCRVTPARLCIYDVCMVLADEISEDEVVSIQTIPAATFAVLDVTCPPEQLNRMWAWMSSTWLPASGRKFAAGRSYEFFPEFGSLPIRSDFGAQLCTPVAA